jgi:hypothetical protein
MPRSPLLKFLALCFSLALVTAACSDDSDDSADDTTSTTEAAADTEASDDDMTTETDAPAEGEADIVDTAVAAGDFTTLATALEAAGLVETLKGDGPFTVFAPTDAAFEALPAGTLDGLLADPEALADFFSTPLSKDSYKNRLTTGGPSPFRSAWARELVSDSDQILRRSAPAGASTPLILSLTP